MLVQSVRAHSVLISGVILLGVGCEGGDREAERPTPEAPAPSVRVGMRETETPLPAPGTATVELVDGRVTILSHEAPRAAVLGRFADEAGFVLETGEFQPALLTVRIEDAEIEHALRALLGGVPYQVDYEFDPVQGRHVVVWLGVGAPPPVEPPAAAHVVVRDAAPPGDGDPFMRAAAAAAAQARLELPSDEARRAMRERRRQTEAEQLALLEDIESPDPEVRAAAAAGLDADGPGMQRLLDALAKDPDPRVRAASADPLGSWGTHLAVSVLLDALGDVDPRVVREAIGALESAGDESLIPQLEPFLEHDDEGVREAAREAIQYLE